MAKKQQSGTSSFALADSTVIEVVRIKGDEVVKKEMTFGEWRNFEKQPGYVYKAYQKGASQYKTK